MLSDESLYEDLILRISSNFYIIIIIIIIRTREARQCPALRRESPGRLFCSFLPSFEDDLAKIES